MQAPLVAGIRDSQIPLFSYLGKNKGIRVNGGWSGSAIKVANRNKGSEDGYAVLIIKNGI
jgi:hypothetical protein